MFADLTLIERIFAIFAAFSYLTLVVLVLGKSTNTSERELIGSKILAVGEKPPEEKGHGR